MNQIRSRFSTTKEIKEHRDIEEQSFKLDGEHSGFPIGSIDNNILVDTGSSHTLVIGSTGSGKTQSTVLPSLLSIINHGDPFMLTDGKGEIYELLYGELVKNDYDIITVDLKEPMKGDGWNPFDVVKKAYDENNNDLVVEHLEVIASHIFPVEPNQDPFWMDSAKNYLMGLVYVLLENECEVNFKSIYDLSNNYDNNGISKLKEYVEFHKNNISSIYLNNVVLAPKETKGSILSVFNQRIRMLISRESLSGMMTSSTFDMTKLPSSRVAIFLIPDDKEYISSLSSIFITQLYNVYMENKRDSMMYFILDEFEYCAPRYHFNYMLAEARGNKIRFLCIVRGLEHLRRIYGPHKIKECFSNVIYLMSNEDDTIDEICHMAGEKEDGSPLITKEELKMFKAWETLVFKLRTMPIKSKLVPFYELNNNIDQTKGVLRERKNKAVEVDFSFLDRQKELDRLIAKIDKKIEELDNEFPMEKVEVENVTCCNVELEKDYEELIKKYPNNKIVIERITIYPKDNLK